MSPAVQIAYDIIKLGLELYSKLSGPPIDLVQLGLDCGVEQARIDDQQAKDEAAENAAAKKVG